MSDTGRGTTPLDPKDAEIERLRRENARIMQEWAISEGTRTGTMPSDDALQARLSEEKHEWYGPCDGFDDGECMECAKTIRDLRARLEQAERERDDMRDNLARAYLQERKSGRTIGEYIRANAALRARETEARGLLTGALDLIRRMHDDEELADPPQIVIAIRAWLDGGKEEG